MKLSRHVFTRSWKVHAWAGVVAALLLHVMFLTGALTLWKHELELWQEPLARVPHVETSHTETLEFVIERLRFTPEDLWISYPEDSHGAVTLDLRRTLDDPWQSYIVDADGGRVLETREELAELIYHLHFLWHDAAPILYYLAGLLSVGLLLALTTGVLVHIKDLLRQFHQFRPHKGERVLWSDLHKVLGVMGLPFQAFYAYTGALFVLTPFVVAAFSGPVFHGDAARAQALAYGLPPIVDAERGEATRVLALDRLVQRAHDEVPELHAHALNVRFHGTTRGVVQVHGALEGKPFGEATIQLRESDGTVLAKQLPEGALNGRLQRWLLGVHFAHFGGTSAKILFTLLALATCATLLSGNWIWLARRQSESATLGYRVLSKLTVGMGAGSIAAVAALFPVSRVLPFSLPNRVTFEELTFLGVLVACVLVALCSPRPESLWRPFLALAGFFCAAAPLAAIRTAPGGLFDGSPSLGAVAAVDVCLLVVGSTLLLGALLLRRGAGERRAERRALDIGGAQTVELDRG